VGTISGTVHSTQQSTSRMRQVKALALLSCDLHRTGVVPAVPIVPAVQSLTAVQSSKVQRSMTTPRYRFFASRRAASACTAWVLSCPLMTDKNTSICYPNRLRNTAGFPSIVSDEQSRSLCGCPAGRDRSRARSAKRIAYLMDERVIHEKQGLCFLHLLSSVRSD